MTATLILGLISALFGTIGYLLNKLTKKIRLPQWLNILKKHITWKNIILIEVFLCIYLMIDSQFIDLVIQKKVPIEVFRQYSYSKGYYCKYGYDGCYYKIHKCTDTDNKTYYEVNVGFQGDTAHVVNFFDQEGKIICRKAWDVRDYISGEPVFPSNCPKETNCTVVVGKE